jgi:hypothetical protein
MFQGRHLWGNSLRRHGPLGLRLADG